MADIRSFGDALEGDLRTAYLNAVDRAVSLVSETELEALLLARDLPALRSLATRLATEGFIESAGPFIDAFEAIFSAAGRSVLATAQIPSLNPRVASYLQGPPAFLLEGLGRDVTTSVRQSIERGYAAGHNVERIARDIRQAIGLLPSHEQAVRRYEQTLRDKGVRPSVIERNVATYQRRLLNWRADTIARSETMIASHAGALEAWKVQLDSGLLLYSRTWMEWDVTEDDRLCERCAPMDGVRVRIGDLFVATHKGFPDGLPDEVPRGRRQQRIGLKPGTRRAEIRDEWLDGELVPLKRAIAVAHPPLHPNCRCTMRLVFDRDL